MIGIDVFRIRKVLGICSLQDAGRHGYRHLAIPQSGFLDSYAATLANFLVGNSEDQTVVEIVNGSLELETLESFSFGISGSDVSVSINSESTGIDQTILAVKGDVIKIKTRLGYLAIPGGFVGQKHFGSISTYTLAQLGGLRGENLKAEDVLLSSGSDSEKKKIVADLQPKSNAIIRILKGPEFAGDDSAFDKINWSVSPDSNRIGLKLQGCNWTHFKPIDQPSPTFPGTIQLPPGGQPIVLLADAQTTGGYPRIGQVIQADLSRAARMLGGGQIKFKFVEIDEAREILYRQEAFLRHALNTLD